MEISAVAEIGKDVGALRERRLADPRRALATHVRRALVLLRIDHGGHHMATDAGQREAAVGHLGRGIVRASRAVVRGAHGRVHRLLEHCLFRLQKGKPRLDQIALVKAPDAPGDDAGDLSDGEIGLGREQPFAARVHPFALIVELADDPRAHVGVPVVKVFLELVLDHLTLFFDDQDFFQPLGEFAHPVRFQRPGHRDLEQPHADFSGVALGHAQFLQRFQHVHVRLARGDDPEPRVGRIDRGAIELVLARVSQRGVDLVVLHQRLLRARLQTQEIARKPAVQSAFGQHKVFGQQGLDMKRICLDRSRRLDRVGQRLEADRASGEPRHGPAVQSQLDVLVHVARVQDRDHRGREQVIALVRQRRGVGPVVVARDQQHAAMLRSAREVHVLEHVAATVHAGSLAIPQGEHPVVIRFPDQVHLLRAPHGGGGEFFVDTGLEFDVMRFEMLGCLPQRLVESAQRRAAIAGDETGGIEPCRQITPALDQSQAHQRLDAGQINAPLIGSVLVGQCDFLHV